MVLYEGLMSSSPVALRVNSGQESRQPGSSGALIAKTKLCWSLRARTGRCPSLHPEGGSPHKWMWRSGRNTGLSGWQPCSQGSPPVRSRGRRSWKVGMTCMSFLALLFSAAMAGLTKLWLMLLFVHSVPVLSDCVRGDVCPEGLSRRPPWALAVGRVQHSVKGKWWFSFLPAQGCVKPQMGPTPP